MRNRITIAMLFCLPSNRRLRLNGRNKFSNFVVSQFGKRIRESCRNLKAKPAKSVSSHNPEDYTSFQLPNVRIINNIYLEN